MCGIDAYRLWQLLAHPWHICLLQFLTSVMPGSLLKLVASSSSMC